MVCSHMRTRPCAHSRIQYTLGFYEHFYHCSLVVPRARGSATDTCVHTAQQHNSLSLLFEFLFDNEEDLEMEKIRSDCNVFEDHDQW